MVSCLPLAVTRADDRLDLLVVSNLWPPSFIGGYELGAHDVVTRLAARGHRVTVLTSTYGVDGPIRDGNVLRLCYEQVVWRALKWPQLLRETMASWRSIPAVRRAVREARFDVVYLFNPLGLNAALVQEICDSGRPVVAYVSDDWAAAWPLCDRLNRVWSEWRGYLAPVPRLSFALAKRVLRRAGVLTTRPNALPMRHVQYTSRYIQSITAGWPDFRTQEVIPWGIDIGRFTYRERRSEELAHWVFAGQVSEHKGVHVAVDAVALLRAQGHAVTLSIHGYEAEPYAPELRRRVEREGLADVVRFMGPCPRERLFADAYQPNGLFVFPTLWEEPFSITLLEAFAAGLPVLTTLTGGTGEIVRHGETATVCSAGSAQHLAAQYLSLVEHPERAAAMARRARAIVAEHLDIERMVDRVEAHLIEVAAGRGSDVPEPYVPRRHPWESPDVRADLPTCAIEPGADDAQWVAALWRDLALGTSPVERATAEVDAELSAVLPAAFPASQVRNGRFATYLDGRLLDVSGGGPVVLVGTTDAARRAARVDLERLPFPDASFDAVLATATFERSRRPWLVVRELARVLRPGGHLVASAAFLEPGHEATPDYFRFTADGLAALARDAGLGVVETAADHSVQHTLAGILWELLRHHPRHRYLTTDARVRTWFEAFTAREGRVLVPTLGDAFCLVARRDS